VAALVAALSAREIAAIEHAAKAAPGPLSALAAAITTFAARVLAARRLAFALMAEPVEPEVDAARASYRQALAAEFEKLIRRALAGGHLPDQDAALAAFRAHRALSAGVVGSPAAGTIAPRRAGAAAHAVRAARARRR
jgi:AcrR family transcriptional regulator